MKNNSKTIEENIQIYKENKIGEKKIKEIFRFFEDNKEGDIDDEEEEEEKEVPESNEIDILLEYNKKTIKINFSKDEKFENFFNFLEKKYFNDVSNFKHNYQIFFEDKGINYNDQRLIKNIINKNGKEVKFILKARKKKPISTELMLNGIYIELENIPSFMDLSHQINIFLLLQNHKEIDYDIKYKDNCCKILFTSSEIAFSFVTFMTNLKFKNEYYRKLKIDIKYNNLDCKDYINNRYFNHMSYNNKRKNKINYKQNKTEPEYKENFESIRDSCPYGYENALEKIQNRINKKKCIGKVFFTRINKNSFNSLISPNKYDYKTNLTNNRKIYINYYRENAKMKIYSYNYKI